jgi:tRNA-modifying protein YgfZ
MTETMAVELDAQYRQLREECGLLDRSDRGKLLLTGPDAAEYLQGQLTNDVEALEPGDGCYAALLDRKGHMQADMRVLRSSAATFPCPTEINRSGSLLFLDTEAGALEVVRRHLEMYKIGREVEMVDVTAELAILSLIGPRSAEIAGTPPLPEYACEETAFAGIDCIVAGTRDGVDLIAPAAEVDRVRTALLDAGAADVDSEATEILRVEAGVPRFGAEMGTETMPAEAGIVEAAVSFTKGCYIGQETVARLHYKGRPNRLLRGMRLGASVEPGAPLLLGEKEVGRVGTACVSPSHGPIALAIVRREAEPGAELAVGEDGVKAHVVDLPFG